MDGAKCKKKTTPVLSVTVNGGLTILWTRPLILSSGSTPVNLTTVTTLSHSYYLSYHVLHYMKISVSQRSPSSKSFYTYVISFRTRHDIWATGRVLSTKRAPVNSISLLFGWSSYRFLEKKYYYLKIAKHGVLLLLRKLTRGVKGKCTFTVKLACNL